MKRSFIFPVSIAILAFGAGYAVCSANKSGVTESDRASAAADGRSGNGRIVLPGGSLPDRGGSRESGRNPVNGLAAPFASGGAKGWLESFGQVKSDDEAALMRFLPDKLFREIEPTP